MPAMIEEATNGSQPLDNPRHERFAVLVAEGKVADWEAYQMAYGCSRESAEDVAYRIRAEVGVCRRIQWLKSQVATSTVLTLREAQEYLAGVVRTPVGEIDASSPYAQEVIDDDRGRRVKSVPKLPALELAAKLAGWLNDGRGETSTAIQINVHVG